MKATNLSKRRSICIEKGTYKMDKNKQWIDLIVELQGLAQVGLTYGKDVYDKERYERIRDISAEMMAELSGLQVEKVKDLFCNETGYQTPKIDTRSGNI